MTSRSKGVVRILHLYPNEMAMYGDSGNVLAVSRRLEWHGYTPQVVEHHRDATMPTDVDMVVGGGGQDSAQVLVAADLVRNAELVHRLADGGVPMFVVCGLYQLFGRTFEMTGGTVVQGVGVFGATTVADSGRVTGNVVVDTDHGPVVGYENHSGRTFLDAGQAPFGVVRKGVGNNDQDRTEGAVHRNVHGTYLHGPALPRNPVLADRLIEQAVRNRHGEFVPGVTDDRVAVRGQLAALQRSR